MSRKGAKTPGFVAAEIVGEDQVQGLAGLGLVFVMPVRVIPAAAADHLLRRQAEEEEVLLARFRRHLDRRAVARADRQRAVHHEFHVARAAGFVARRRNLVGDVAGGDQVLGKRDAVLGQEHDFEPPAYCRVAVDGASQIVDEFDNQFGEPICGGSLAGEEECPWRHVQAQGSAVAGCKALRSCRAFSSWRLYSWMRLIWQSKIASGSRTCPVDHLNQSQNCCLASSLGLQEVVAEALVVREGFQLAKLAEILIQPSPIASVMSSESPGLHSSSQRRGVTPFVLLLKRSGKISARSFSVVLRSRSE